MASKKRRLWVDEDFMKLIIRAQEDLMSELGIKLSITDVTKILANRMKTEKVVITPPKPKSNKWTFDIEFNPKF